MIPAWNLQGVIPPVRPGVAGHHADRSPYKATLDAFVDAMGNSPPRLAIVEGLLRFRSEIRAAGITVGFQWLDGSFLEHAEATEGRDPRDVDVVTFIEIPPGATEAALVAANPHLFDNAHVKKTHQVDSYWDVLGGSMNEASVQRIAYWYSMWSHRRDGLWKGFVQIDLSPANDLLAAQAVAQAKLALGITP